MPLVAHANSAGLPNVVQVANGIRGWRMCSTVNGLARRADEARAAGRLGEADALLLDAWAAFDA